MIRAMIIRWECRGESQNFSIGYNFSGSCYEISLNSKKLISVPNTEDFEKMCLAIKSLTEPVETKPGRKSLPLAGKEEG